MNEVQINKIKSLLSDKKGIVIIPHKNPDGDAIGSSTGLKGYLDKLGHSVEIIREGSGECPDKAADGEDTTCLQRAVRGRP